jgi:hypothetical protein
MKTQTITEIASALFFSLASSGGEQFKRHAGNVITDAIATGVITDPAARKFLTKLAEIAAEPALPPA